MKTYIVNVNLITPTQRMNDMNIVLENGKIVEITHSAIRPEPGSIQINAKNNFLCPGFIDIHFHGAMGRDTMDGDRQSLQLLSNYCSEHGVTTFYPTTWASSANDLLAVISNFKEYKNTLKGAHAPGLHIEGPYINVIYRGAQKEHFIRNPSVDEYRQWFDSGVVKLITCAPEITGGIEFIKSAVENDVRISIGHSGATYDQVIEAVNSGATQATHLFNGMQGLHHRQPGTVGGLLDDERIFTQIICDGAHIHPAIVRIILKVKSVFRVILVTDSVCGAGLPDGNYDHIGQIFNIIDGIARTSEGGLSGSTLALDAALRNAMTFTGRSVEEILPLVTSTPAEAMGISKRKGFIKVGFDADLVLLNNQFLVEKTFVDGNVVFTRK